RGIIQEAIRLLKSVNPELLVITDVCLCEYTSHGHCGLIHNGSVQNDASLELLARMALTHAEAGADLVAPSDMMDGRVGAIRQVRDRYDLPVAAYNVSGEFAMIKAAAQNGWIDERRVAMEVLTGIRRAGADMIITYFAPDVAGWLRES